MNAHVPIEAADTCPAPVAKAIAEVMGKVNYVQKKGVNEFHRYKFAAVGDILAKLQPAMAEAGLVVIQDELHHELVADGAIMEATYGFTIAHSSGSVWPRVAKHTGMAGAKNTKGGFDDKALNKCHTAARKYFLLALFQIPTGDATDPDEDGDHEPAAPTALDENQIAHLRKLLDDSGANEPAFLAAYKVASLDAFPAGSYDHAVKALHKKLALVQAEAA